ncbi:MAG TPA: head-tail connector protein [Calditerricola sp.]
MGNLITREQAYEHLRLDYDSGGSADDGWLSVFIPAVSEAVQRWLKEDWRLYEWETDSDGNIVRDSDGNPVPLLDSDGEPVVKPVVRAACLLELASQYRFREGEGRDNAVPSHEGYGHGLTSKAAVALLTTIRRPTVS